MTDKATMTNCTISGNTTSGGGGGFYSTHVIMTNCTINGNATSGGHSINATITTAQ